jgi:hypothetical protein
MQETSGAPADLVDHIGQPALYSRQRSTGLAELSTNVLELTPNSTKLLLRGPRILQIDDVRPATVVNHHPPLLLQQAERFPRGINRDPVLLRKIPVRGQLPTGREVSRIDRLPKPLSQLATTEAFFALLHATTLPLY